MKARFLQLLVIADVSRYIVGDSAAAVGDEFAGVHQGNFGIRRHAFDATCGLGAKGHAADDNDFERHENSLKLNMLIVKNRSCFGKNMLWVIYFVRER